MLTQISSDLMKRKQKYYFNSPGPKGYFRGYCADLSTSMKSGTNVEQNILNSFFEGAEAGAY